MLGPTTLFRSSKLSAVSILGLLTPFGQLVLRTSPAKNTTSRLIHSFGPTCVSVSMQLKLKGAEDAQETNKSKDDPIHNFFRQYPDFPYDTTSDYANEFNRLRRHKGWPTKAELKRDKEDRGATSEARRLVIDQYIDAKKAFATAQVKAFGRDIGTEVEDLGAWTKLCLAASIDPVPETRARCKSAIRSSFVNLVDLHAYMRRPSSSKAQKPHRFESLNQLREYTIDEDRFFPKEEAKENGSLLKYLLKPILSRQLRRSDRLVVRVDRAGGL